MFDVVDDLSSCLCDMLMWYVYVHVTCEAMTGDVDGVRICVMSPVSERVRDDGGDGMLVKSPDVLTIVWEEGRCEDEWGDDMMAMMGRHDGCDCMCSVCCMYDMNGAYVRGVG